MNFHILINMFGLFFITRAQGSITSNILKLDKAYFSIYDFKENKSNTPSGFAMKMDMKDFDFAYKILDSD